MRLKPDCRHYLGWRPCAPAKQSGARCQDCASYERRGKSILIIKLGAAGDVLRTTFLLPALSRKAGRGANITWLAAKASLPVLQNPFISCKLDADSPASAAVLLARTWDGVYCLENSSEAAAFCAAAKARKKYGFTLSSGGAITPLGSAAALWLELACDDTLKKNNSLSYQEIMLKICGLGGKITPPIFTPSAPALERARAILGRKPGQTLVGLNTGAGSRWPKKMLSARDSADLCRRILASDKKISIILLGGPEQSRPHALIKSLVKNKRLISAGTDNSFDVFAALISLCDAVICGDTLALHSAAAAGTPCVALFGPTSKNEIYDYDGMVEKLDAGLDCLCCYGDCGKTRHCMNALRGEEILSALKKQLAFKNKGRGK